MTSSKSEKLDENEIKDKQMKYKKQAEASIAKSKKLKEEATKLIR